MNAGHDVTSCSLRSSTPCPAALVLRLSRVHQRGDHIRVDERHSVSRSAKASPVRSARPPSDRTAPIKSAKLLARMPDERARRAVGRRTAQELGDRDILAHRRTAYELVQFGI
jgi:hypothetical protein